MFGLFKASPLKALKKQYSQKLEEAMLLQRKGDMAGYAEKTAEAEAIEKELQKLEG